MLQPYGHYILSLAKLSFHHKWNEHWLSVINWYIRAASGVAQRLTKVQNNSWNSWNIIHGIITQYPVFLPPKKFFVNTSKRLLENRSWTFPVVRYFSRKLEFFSNILSLVFSGNKFLFLTRPRFLQIWLFCQFW